MFSFPPDSPDDYAVSHGEIYVIYISKNRGRMSHSPTFGDAWCTASYDSRVKILIFPIERGPPERNQSSDVRTRLAHLPNQPLNMDTVYENSANISSDPK